MVKLSGYEGIKEDDAITRPIWVFLDSSLMTYVKQLFPGVRPGSCQIKSLLYILNHFTVEGQEAGQYYISCQVFLLFLLIITGWMLLLIHFLTCEP